jgi:hypothetical protein
VNETTLGTPTIIPACRPSTSAICTNSTGTNIFRLLPKSSNSAVVNGTKFQLFDQASLKTSLRILSSSCNCGRRTGRMRILPETSARRADSVITAGGVAVGSSIYATTSFVLW